MLYATNERATLTAHLIDIGLGSKAVKILSIEAVDQTTPFVPITANIFDLNIRQDTSVGLGTKRDYKRGVNWSGLWLGNMVRVSFSGCVIGDLLWVKVITDEPSL